MAKSKVDVQENIFMIKKLDFLSESKLGPLVYFLILSVCDQVHNAMNLPDCDFPLRFCWLDHSPATLQNSQRLVDSWWALAKVWL